MKNKPLLVLLDAGHGGVINGVYQTAGKRSPIWPDGTQLFEGVFNRSIVNGIAALLKPQGIECQLLVPEQDDISLVERVKRANRIYNDHRKTHNVILVSVHANAGGGTGFEVFTYYGQSESDIIASFIADEFNETFPNERLRTDTADGDVDKEADFYLLRRTSMAAVLTENFFMDTEKDCKTLMSEEGQDKIIEYHVKGIINYGKAAGSITKNH